MNLSRKVYFFILLLSFGVLPLSCGIPQFSPLPTTPSLQVTGTDILLSLEPTTNEYTQGIVIMYKIYERDGLTSSVYNNLMGYTLGSQAYDAFVQAGYAVVVNASTGTADTPSLVLSDFPTLFTDPTLEAGFTSSATSDRIELIFGGNSLTVNVFQGITELGSWALQRNGASIYNPDFTQLISNYKTSDSDVPVTFINGNEPLDIAIAVFGYRSSFGEGVQYSLPALVTPTEVYNIN